MEDVNNDFLDREENIGQGRVPKVRINSEISKRAVVIHVRIKIILQYDQSGLNF